ncbi:MAG TPA: hypothetical protein PKD45_07280 [Flavobacteriales bacterium]|nr:hypothetical protein [Flavobacteriales bacterium]
MRFTNEQVLEHMVSVIGHLEDLVQRIEDDQGDRSREAWKGQR